MTRLRLRALSALLLATSLAACVSTSRDSLNLPPMPDWGSRQAALTEVRDWEFKGRIAVKSGDDGFNARFDWRQNGPDFQATVSGPLGIGTVRIEGNPRRIELTDKDGGRAILTDPEAELMYRYGWTLPLQSLRYWALGVPDPATRSATTHDASGKLSTLQQGGWQLTISRYREAAGQPMPRTLTATNTQSDAETRVRIVIDRWAFYAL